MKQTETSKKDLQQPGNHAAMTTPHPNRFAVKRGTKHD